MEQERRDSLVRRTIEEKATRILEQLESINYQPSTTKDARLKDVVKQIEDLQQLWREANEKRMVEECMMASRKLLPSLIQALSQSQGHSEVFSAVGSMLLMMWSGYGKTVEMSKNACFESGGVKLLGMPDLSMFSC